MKKSKRIAALLMAAAMTATFAGCGNGSDGGNAAGDGGENAEGGKNITVILKNSTAPFFISMAEGAQAAGEELGYNVEVKTPVDTAEGSGNEQQNQLCDEAIVNGVDCVVLCPVDTEAIVPAAQRIVDADIPVVALNTRLGDESLCETFVGLENVQQGYETAKALFEKMGGTGTLIIIEGSTGAQTSLDRIEGCKKALEEYPDIELVASQSANYSRAEALNVAQNLLQSYPDVDAFFCCNDEMALGTAEAVDAAGKTGEIMISGQDANDDAVSALKEGKITLTSWGDPYMQGYEGVVAAVDVLEGNEVKEFYEVSTKVVDETNVDSFKDE